MLNHLVSERISVRQKISAFLKKKIDRIGKGIYRLELYVPKKLKPLFDLIFSEEALILHRCEKMKDFLKGLYDSIYSGVETDLRFRGKHCYVSHDNIRKTEKLNKFLKLEDILPLFSNTNKLLLLEVKGCPKIKELIILKKIIMKYDNNNISFHVKNIITYFRLKKIFADSNIIIIWIYNFCRKSIKFRKKIS